MKYLILTCLFLFASSIFVKAQETIWLLNGEKIITSKYSIDKKISIFFYQNKKGKTKDVALEYVFSIVDSLGKETVLYIPDTTDEIGNFTYNESQMREYVEGCKIANKNYKAPLAFVTGFIFGGSAPLVTAVSGVSLLFTPLVPAFGTTIVSLVKPNIKTFNKKYPNKKANLSFTEGYLDVAREKRTKNSIFGGLTGLIITTLTIMAISN